MCGLIDCTCFQPFNVPALTLACLMIKAQGTVFHEEKRKPPAPYLDDNLDSSHT
jgi:hypothetical protein